MENKVTNQCAGCKWAMPLEERYDQIHCCNNASSQAWSDVEATECCELFSAEEKTSKSSK
jgi:hypothetical protein